MKQKIDYRFIICIALSILSFAVGVFFGGTQTHHTENTQDFVNLIIKDKTLEVVKTNQNIGILVNGKLLGTGSIQLELAK